MVSLENTADNLLTFAPWLTIGCALMPGFEDFNFRLPSDLGVRLLLSLPSNILWLECSSPFCDAPGDGLLEKWTGMCLLVTFLPFLFFFLFPLDGLLMDIEEFDPLDGRLSDDDESAFSETSESLELTELFKTKSGKDAGFRMTVASNDCFSGVVFNGSQAESPISLSRDCSFPLIIFSLHWRLGISISCSSSLTLSLLEGID